jgi:hypothetical protein
VSLIIYDGNLNSWVFLLKIFIEDNNVEGKPHRMNVRTSQVALVNLYCSHKFLQISFFEV